MPMGCAPAVPGVGALGSLAAMPLSTATPLTVFPPESTNQGVVQSGETQTSAG